MQNIGSRLLSDEAKQKKCKKWKVKGDSSFDELVHAQKVFFAKKERDGVFLTDHYSNVDHKKVLKVLRITLQYYSLSNMFCFPKIKRKCFAQSEK